MKSKFVKSQEKFHDIFQGLSRNFLKRLETTCENI